MLKVEWTHKYIEKKKKTYCVPEVLNTVNILIVNKFTCINSVDASATSQEICHNTIIALLNALNKWNLKPSS